MKTRGKWGRAPRRELTRAERLGIRATLPGNGHVF